METSSERNLAIDVCKGGAILLVVAGHSQFVLDCPDVWCGIYSFHMPLFFALAGVTLNAERAAADLKAHALRRARQLLIPAAIFTLVWWCYTVVGRALLGGDDRPGSVLYDLPNPLGAVMHANWFLVVLYGADLLYVASYRVLRGRVESLASLAAVALLLGIFLPQGTVLFFRVNVIPAAFFFVALGNFVRPVVISYRPHCPWPIALVGAVALFMAAQGAAQLGPEVCMRMQCNRINELSASLALLGSAGAYLCAAALTSFNAGGGAKVLVWCGRLSLSIMCLHQFVQDIMDRGLPLLGLGIDSALVRLLATLVLTLPIAWLLDRYAPWLFGRSGTRRGCVGSKEKLVGFRGCAGKV